MKCNLCKQEYTPECDYNQGRCPHHPPMINIQPRDTSQGHFYVSLFKSATRIVAGMFLIWPGSLVLAGAFLIVAEVLGILEEVV
jgi:hypothetical protein